MIDNNDDVMLGFISGILFMLVIAVIVIVIGFDGLVSGEIEHVLEYMGEVMDTGQCVNDALNQMDTGSRNLVLEFVINKGMCAS